ncbi:cytochrome P450 [Geopyxis carbonaria]|nr:cytochrome P450 [Geopyxis carbonaria]
MATAEIVATLLQPSTLYNWKLWVATTLIYIFSICIYRLYFHPLSHVPGPRLAAISTLWQIYWNVIRGGELTSQLPRVCQQYGTVVRIGPNDVFIHDPALYNTVMKRTSGFTKSPTFYTGFGFPTASFALIDSVPQRTRRHTLLPLFGPKAIEALEGVIVDKFTALFQVLDRNEKAGRASGIHTLFMCTTMDIISAYCFGKSFDMILRPEGQGETIANVLSFSNSLWLLVHFPWIAPLALNLPRALGNLVARQFLENREMCKDVVREFLEAQKGFRPKGGPDTIFDVLTNATTKTAKIPGFEDLVDEAINLVTAGTDNSATVMSFAVYRFCSEPVCREKILAELDKLTPNSTGNLDMADLRALPYLNAFIKEVLRLDSPVPGRLPRRVPAGAGLHVASANLHLPSGTDVSFGHQMVHLDPSIFANPSAFWPDRFLVDRDLDQWVLSFGKGARACLGRGFAFAQIALVLGNLFWKYDIRLHDTTATDMEWDDFGVAHCKGNLQIRTTPRVVSKD